MSSSKLARRPAPRRRKAPAEGIALRHSRRCASRTGRECSCSPTYQAMVWAAAQNKPVRKSFATLGAARAWRAQAQVDLRRGRLSAPSENRLAQAAQEWLSLAERGVIRTRSGSAYKPSALRGYREALAKRVLPALGQRRLSAITRNDVQDLIDELLGGGLAPSTAANAVLPLRAIYRRAAQRGEVAANPTLKLAMPTQPRTRQRVARAQEAGALIDALALCDRALWASALYAGLRRGELQALGWEDVDLDGRLIHVRRSWDRVAGAVEPKSRAGRRRVPLSQALRRRLLAHRLAQGSGGEGLVFPSSVGRPFDPPTVARRAQAAWERAGLEPIGLHQCRHNYAALMIAAGVNAKALSAYMGHSTITVTLDRYGHLMPGNEAEAAQLLDDYLERAPG